MLEDANSELEQLWTLQVFLCLYLRLVMLYYIVGFQPGPQNAESSEGNSENEVEEEDYFPSTAALLREQQSKL